jgi:hypothetical protein
MSVGNIKNLLLSERLRSLRGGQGSFGLFEVEIFLDLFDLGQYGRKARAVSRLLVPAGAHHGGDGTIPTQDIRLVRNIPVQNIR